MYVVAPAKEGFLSIYIAWSQEMLRHVQSQSKFRWMGTTQGGSKGRTMKEWQGKKKAQTSKS